MVRFILVCALLALSVAYEEPDSSCLACICEVESRCSAIGCHMDEGSLSCGYYQIKDPYYSDALQFHNWHPSDTDPLIYPWKQCANDKSCATSCVRDYMARYAQGDKCSNGASGCEKFARIHNGGPNGCRNSGTIGYWNKVKACLQRKEAEKNQANPQ